MKGSGVAAPDESYPLKEAASMTLLSEEYRLIPLTQGQFATVDVEDFDRLSQHKWFAYWNPCTKSFYARRNISVGKKKQTILSMHREILGIARGSKQVADHINHDTLDNRRFNLRIATYSENQWNTLMRKGNPSGFKGVTRKPKGFTANITLKRKKIYLGLFNTAEEAYKAYCEAAKRLHGDFANTGGKENTMNIEDAEILMKDLCDVEPRSIGTDQEAKDAGAWLSLVRDVETASDEYFDLEIKQAHQKHKKLVAEKKGFLEKLVSAKDRIRVSVANWIAGGHALNGFYIKRSFRIVVIDPELVPAEYWVRQIDEEKVLTWVKQTDGKMGVPGVQIEPVNVLFTGQAEKNGKGEVPAPPLKEQLQQSLAMDDSQPKLPKIAMQRIKGRNLVEIAWVEVTLWCGFARKEKGREHGVSVYSYNQVPEAVYLTLLRSPFPDRQFQSAVKGKFSAEKWS